MSVSFSSQLTISTKNSWIVPSSEIDFTDYMPKPLPREIWKTEIFSYIGIQDLKLFTEHKVNVLKKPLDGRESFRLMRGDMFIFHEKDFSDVVKNVYNFTLCCKHLYEITQPERKLLIEVALAAKTGRTYFSSETRSRTNQEDENTRFLDSPHILEMNNIMKKNDSINLLFEIPKQIDFVNYTLKDKASKLSLEAINLVTDKFNLEQFKTQDLNLKEFNLKKLELEKFKIEDLKSLKNITLEKNKLEPIENKTQKSTVQEQSFQSKDDGRCVLQ